MIKLKSILYGIGIALLVLAILIIVCAVGLSVLVLSIEVLSLIVEALIAGAFTALPSIIFSHIVQLPGLCMICLTELELLGIMCLCALYVKVVLAIDLATQSGGFSQIPSMLLTKASSTDSIFNRMAIRILLKLGADINGFINPQMGYTSPLARVIRTANTSMIQFLMEHGADINYTFSYFNSPLETAIERRNLNVIKTLIETNERIHGPLAQAVIHVKSMKKSICHFSDRRDYFIVQRKAHRTLSSRKDQIILLKHVLSNEFYDIAKLLIEDGIVFTSDENDKFFSKENKNNYSGNDFVYHAEHIDPRVFFSSTNTFVDYTIYPDPSQGHLFKGKILLSQNKKNNTLKYVVKNHFGDMVSGNTTIQIETDLIDQTSLDSLSKRDQDRIQFEILLKVSRDDFCRLMQPYIQMQEQAIAIVPIWSNTRASNDKTNSIEAEQPTAAIPIALCTVIAEYAGGCFDQPQTRLI